jgi:hypothetical protein
MFIPPEANGFQAAPALGAAAPSAQTATVATFSKRLIADPSSGFPGRRDDTSGGSLAPAPGRLLIHAPVAHGDGSRTTSGDQIERN